MPTPLAQAPSVPTATPQAAQAARPPANTSAPGGPVDAEAAATAAAALGLATVDTPSAAEGGRVLNVAVLADAPPFSSVGRFGARTGFDVDIANALCARLDARCKLAPMPAEDILPALSDRRVEMAVATPVLNDARQDGIVFTRPYVRLGVRFVTPREDGRADPERRAVYGALAGSAEAAYLAKSYPQPDQLRLYPSQEEMWIDLALRRLDSVLTPAISARREFLATPIGGNFRFAAAADATDEALARPGLIAVRAGDPGLRRELDDAISEFLASPEYGEILRRSLDTDLASAPRAVAAAPQ